MTQLGHDVFDPWSLHFGEAIREASQIQSPQGRVSALTRLARDIGAANEDHIRGSDMLLGVLDGTEVNSGTASKIGFATGIGLQCYGLRTFPATGAHRQFSLKLTRQERRWASPIARLNPSSVFGTAMRWT